MTIPSPIVFVVDDEPSILKAVSRLLRSAGIGVETFSSSKEFLERHVRHAHGCIVLDVQMPGLTGLELQNALLTDGVGMPIIFLTGHGDVSMTAKAMKRGAADFLTKPLDSGDLLEAVRGAIAKDRISWVARAEIAEIQERVATLTTREVEVLTHIVAGKLNKQIAASLGNALQTVKTHRGRIMEKLRVESVADLVRLAERAGIKVAQ
jgi:FixJ family two-component response regulator